MKIVCFSKKCFEVCSKGKEINNDLKKFIFNSTSFVRKSVLFSFTLILMVIPNDLLFSGLNNYFVELKYWLEGKNFILL